MQENIENNKNQAINSANDPNLTEMFKTRSYKDLERFLSPEIPVNIYVSGDTGLGKSTAILNICKSRNMPVIRVNLSFLSDVDDIIGGLRLIDGNTVFEAGPVIEGMRIGATVILDEVDHASPRLLSELMPIAEGKGYLIKKTREMIYPKKGFRLVATGNTKGTGDETGEFSGTNVLNKAFLDRFATWIDFLPPTKHEMEKIINLTVNDITPELAGCLSSWYSQILDSLDKGVVVKSVSTRRVIEIAKLFKVFDVHLPEDKTAKEAIKFGTNLYDSETSDAFVQLWDNIATNAINDRKAQEDKKMKAAKLQKNQNDQILDEDGEIVPF